MTLHNSEQSSIQNNSTTDNPESQSQTSAQPNVNLLTVQEKPENTQGQNTTDKGTSNSQQDNQQLTTKPDNQIPKRVITNDDFDFNKKPENSPLTNLQIPELQIDAPPPPPKPAQTTRKSLTNHFMVQTGESKIVENGETKQVRLDGYNITRVEGSKVSFDQSGNVSTVEIYPLQDKRGNSLRDKGSITVDKYQLEYNKKGEITSVTYLKDNKVIEKFTPTEDGKNWKEESTGKIKAHSFLAETEKSYVAKDVYYDVKLYSDKSSRIEHQDGSVIFFDKSKNIKQVEWPARDGKPSEKYQFDYNKTGQITGVTYTSNGKITEKLTSTDGLHWKDQSGKTYERTYLPSNIKTGQVLVADKDSNTITLKNVHQEKVIHTASAAEVNEQRIKLDQAKLTTEEQRKLQELEKRNLTWSEQKQLEGLQNKKLTVEKQTTFLGFGKVRFTTEEQNKLQELEKRVLTPAEQQELRNLQHKKSIETDIQKELIAKEREQNTEQKRWEQLQEIAKSTEAGLSKGQTLVTYIDSKNQEVRYAPFPNGDGYITAHNNDDLVEENYKSGPITKIVRETKVIANQEVQSKTVYYANGASVVSDKNVDPAVVKVERSGKTIDNAPKIKEVGYPTGCIRKFEYSNDELSKVTFETQPGKKQGSYVYEKNSDNTWSIKDSQGSIVHTFPGNIKIDKNGILTIRNSKTRMTSEIHSDGKVFQRQYE